MIEIICARCGVTELATKEEREELEREARELWGDGTGEMKPLCGDCYADFMAWFKAHRAQ